MKVRVTDQDAIPKFLDGRYATVSIGGTMGTVTCNICGKTILKDGKFKFCGHWRGETYKDQLCYWGAKDITYHEVSTVNNPADDFAQIMKVTVVTDKGGSDSMDGQGTDNNTAATNSNTAAEDMKKSVCDMIDKLMAQNNGMAQATDNNQASEAGAATDDSTKGADAAQDGAQASATDNSDEVAELKKQLEDANEKVSDLEKEVKDALTKAQDELKAAQEEAKSATDMCMTLAKANKEMVADSIIKKEKDAKKLTDDKAEDRKKELMAMSMKDLNKLVEEASAADANGEQRTSASVANPGLADRSKDDGNNKDSNGTADTDKGTANNAKKRTVNDVANDIVSKLCK